MSIGTPHRFRGIFRTDDDARAVYSEGAGIQRIVPVAIAVPADVDDLAALVEWAHAEETALIPRGSGSGMAGAAIGRGVIVDLSRWKHVDETNLDSNRLAVGPGVICAQADAVARAKGLRLPVDPSSAAFCTVGGMTSTNAAGAHTLAFGSMRDWVTGVECMFADGSWGWIRRGDTQSAPSAAPPTVASLFDRRGSPAFVGAKHGGVRKDSSGYAAARFAESGDLVDLLVGSEGTLAFFTNIELRLAAVPGAEASVMGVFQSLGAATEAAISAREAGAVACELLDKTFLDFVATASGKPFEAATEAILLADAEGANVAAAAASAAAIIQSFRRAGASETRVATAAAEREALWSLRHAASPTLARLSDRLKSMQFVEDAAVPPQHLGTYVAGVRAALDRHRIRGVIFGHAGDAHIHVNPLVDVSAPDWRRTVDALLDEVTTLVASLEGTLSGEHGDGRLRTPLLPRVWSGESLGAFSEVKRAFDPVGLLNPGVKTPASGVTGPPSIKYDPALPPLGPRAAHALAEVEQSRAYSSFRLDLLG